MPVVWGFGATIGPLIGGSLSHPHERFSKVLSGSFWKEYPYFLPCLATSTYVLIAFVTTLFLFKETVPKRSSRQSSTECREGPKVRTADKPVALRELLVYPVMLSISNYVFLAFLNISVNALLPLFLAMPLEIGGLNLSPPTIGCIIGSYGAASAIFKVIYFARIVRRWGERRVFIVAISTFLPVFLLLPIINFVARRWGQLSFGVCLLVGCLLAMIALMDMAYGTIFMFITASAPNKRSLGATNGLSQMTVSIARAIGPALSTSLFSFSVQNDILGGFGVYVFFATLSVLALLLATRLPFKVWDQYEPEHDTTSP
ncbi:MFS general substrate transporter [Phlegmacium glaucopus]|nr:MFS general substrate transporter [Phlegmacium glaucopus]